MPTPEPIEIGALSRCTGCSIDTIRYYERVRLLPAVPRTEGGHRLYSHAHVRRLQFIRRSREIGLSLRQVRELLEDMERSACSCSGVRSLLSERLAAVRSRIRDLRDLERNLRTMLDECGDAELTNCRLMESMLAGEATANDTRCCT